MKYSQKLSNLVANLEEMAGKSHFTSGLSFVSKGGTSREKKSKIYFEKSETISRYQPLPT